MNRLVRPGEWAINRLNRLVRPGEWAINRLYDRPEARGQLGGNPGGGAREFLAVSEAHGEEALRFEVVRFRGVVGDGRREPAKEPAKAAAAGQRREGNAMCWRFLNNYYRQIRTFEK